MYRQEPGEVSLATFWRQKSPGSTYVRCTLPARHLPGQCLPLTDRDGHWDKDQGRAVFPRQRGGAAIWQFPGNAARALIMDGMREQGIKQIVEIDDNYLVSAPRAGASRDWHPTIASVGVDRSSREQHELIVSRVAHGVIVATPHLAEMYRKRNDCVYVCPNCVDSDDWPGPFKPDDGIFRIGYAGGGMHTRDFPMVQRSLEWASRQPDIEIIGIGQAIPPGLSWVQYVPWTDTLSSYRNNLSMLDVGVAPLRPDLWSAGKSDLKVLEYSMAGALSIVSRERPYKPWFDIETPVLIADSYKEWQDHIEWCVSHRDEVRRLAVETKNLVLATREIRQGVKLWEEVLEDV